MDYRTIDFAGHSIPIVRDAGIDWVAVKPILAYLYREKDPAGELQGMNKKYEVSVFNLFTARGNRANQKCLHSGQLETWLYSFAHRRGHFKHPDGQFLSRVKHARETLPDLIFSSAPVEVPEPESEVVEPTHEPAIPSESTEVSPEPPPEPTPQMRAMTYTAFPLGTLTGVIDAVIESTEMQIAILTEFKEAFEEMRNSEFLLADNHRNGRASQPQ